MMLDMSTHRGYFVVLAFAAALPLAAQTLIEYSLGTARSAGAASGMRAAGKSVAGALDKTTRTLDGAKSSSSVVIISGSQAAPGEVKLSPLPDPSAVKIGMEPKQVLAKFGEPAMKLSFSEGTDLVEDWTYGASPDTVTLTFRAGKVAKVTAPEPPKQTNPQEVTIVR
jgi:hypothetical protein